MKQNKLLYEEKVLLFEQCRFPSLQLFVKTNKFRVRGQFVVRKIVDCNKYSNVTYPPFKIQFISNVAIMFHVI